MFLGVASQIRTARRAFRFIVMKQSKMVSRVAVVERRLRRSLGSLLALGFGAVWWSFVTPPALAASVPTMVVPVPPTLVASPHVLFAALEPAPPPAPPRARIRDRPRVPPPVDKDPPVDTDPTKFDPIASLLPIDPMNDLTPPRVVEEPPDLPPIITRSS